MAKLSVIIPSRDERFLFPTIEDIFRNRRGNTEVIAVLDQDSWPGGWKELTDKYPDLHTVHMGSSQGMRSAINAGFGSALSRGADYVMKLDGHCALSEGFDEVLLAEIEPNWVVIPRRGRLDPENWCATETHKPDIDYHYLSFPDDPNDFGGPGLNGKVWTERAVERKDILLDEEMSSQGSAWLTSVDYFQQLELMDHVSYSEFWAEMQEIGLKCWLSGGKLMVNKKATYLHLHKGRKYGRGYRLAESLLVQGATYTKNWIWNEAWSKQTLPFEWLIDHFWPVPSWPENWREVLYRQRKPRAIIAPFRKLKDSDMVRVTPESGGMHLHLKEGGDGLQVHSAWYGVDVDNKIDVTERVRELVKDDVLDIRIDNGTLTPGKNPFRGKRKVLSLQYGFDGSEWQFVQRYEKDVLIIGTPRATGSAKTARLASKHDVREDDVRPTPTEKFCPRCGRPFQLSNGAFPIHAKTAEEELREVNPTACSGSGKKYEVVSVVREVKPPMTAAALNDFLLRKFQISSYRLRAPMPIELPNFHRNDLAKLFGELGFTKGAEVGVAEGHFSETLCQSILNLEKLYCVDPWHRYSENPQGHSKEHHEFALNETKRRLALFGDKVKLVQEYSMDAVRKIEYDSLDFVNIDGHHSFPFVMQDIIEWSKRVRPGGVILLDDYMRLDPKRWGAGPIEAVQAWTSAMDISPWFVCQGHRSVDVWWVKP